MDNYQIIDAILRREGSRFTDDLADRGGPTKFGITQSAWVEYLGRSHEYWNLPDLVRDLTVEQARAFYWTMHVAPLAWIEHDELRELVIDSAINHGASRATKWMQAAAGASPDGVIGPKTKAAVNPASHSDTVRTLFIYNEILRTRFRFYAKIATDQREKPGGDPDAKYLSGWINRACEFIRP